MDKEAYGASGFEHGTVAGVLWQKGALGLAARSQANSGPERVGKESYFHLRSIAPSKTREDRVVNPCAGLHIQPKERERGCQPRMNCLLTPAWQGHRFRWKNRTTGATGPFFYMLSGARGHCQ
jgi:hypothetical protein